MIKARPRASQSQDCLSSLRRSQVSTNQNPAFTRLINSDQSQPWSSTALTSSVSTSTPPMLSTPRRVILRILTGTLTKMLELIRMILGLQLDLSGWRYEYLTLIGWNTKILLCDWSGNSLGHQTSSELGESRVWWTWDLCDWEWIQW